jgi:quercetin dioxygenase-like cupin family protein
MAATAAPTGWHRTNTIDYEYIVSGRIDLLMEDGSSTTLEAGDVNVQLGGMHQWWNRYEEPCVLAIIMVGVPSDEEAGVLITPLDEAQRL